MKELFLQPQTPGQDTREYTYQMIRQNLLELTLPPHTQLSEAMVAQLLDVSRTPVHDAFARLDEEGLMCAVPQKGTLVAPISANRVEQGVFIAKRVCARRLFFRWKAISTGNIFALERKTIVSLPRSTRRFTVRFTKVPGFATYGRRFPFPVQT